MYKTNKYFRKETRKLVLRYCQEQEINALRCNGLKVKSQYLTKHRHLKFIGNKHALMDKVDNFIHQNIDQIYMI